jgi:Cu(I)/Ag(I) efflux system periplasmic protein CusF
MKHLFAFILALITGIAMAQNKQDFADAEIRKIDKDNKKITLKHGEIQNLDMPPMTMVFVVKDATLLDAVQVGDKVQFIAVKEGREYVVTVLKQAK